MKKADQDAAMLSCNFSYDNDIGYLKISVFPDRVFLVPTMVGSDLLHRLTASVCCFATAVNYPNGAQVQVETPFAVPFQFESLVREYNDLQRYSKVYFGNVSAKREKMEEGEPHHGVAHLLSGGKDSVSKLIQLCDKYSRDHVRCVFVRGTTVNTEFLDEYKAVKNITKHLKVKLEAPTVWHGDYGQYSLRTRLRTIWREMLLLVIARNYSNHISLGEAYDPGLHSSLDKIRSCDCSSLYMSATRLTFDTFSDMMSSTIEFADSELENYRFMKEEHPDILQMTRSCFNPWRKCKPIEDWEGACKKCKTFHIYDKILDSIELNPEEIDFVRSTEWVGETTIRDQYLGG